MGNWKDAYEAQMDLWKWTKSVDGLNQMFNTSDYDKLHPDTQALVTTLIREEQNKLLGADPIFVAAEFSDLIDMATPSFAPEPLLQTDFICPQGFLFYERPLVIETRHPGKTMLLAGFSWTPLVGEADTERPTLMGMALTLYERVDPDTIHIEYEDGERIHFPQIVPSHLTPWYFGMTFDGNESDMDGLPTAVEQWWRPAQVTLRLMQQKLAAREPSRVERASRRRGEKLGFSPREVVVVRLRRHRAAPTGSEVDVKWSHRWIVRGGWQWRRYGPGHTLLRQVWIGNYVKGPEGLPLLPKGRSFQWEE